MKDSDDKNSQEGGAAATEEDTDSSDESLSDQDSSPSGSTTRMPALGCSHPTGRLPSQLENEDTDKGGYAIPPPILVDSYPASLA